MKAILRRTGVLLWFMGLAAAMYLMFRLILPYTGLQKNVDFLLTKQKVYHIDYWRISFYAHVFASIIVLPAGFTQFSSTVLHSSWHRRLGMMYIVVVLFISAPTGFLMGLHANGGLAAKASFVLLSLLWFLTTLMALLSARNRRFAAHGEYLLFSYALTLSAITFRLYAWLFDILDIHVRPQEVYVTIAWLSWVPNLIVAEWLIRNGFIQRILKIKGR
jgi:hypothetical protein